MQQVEGARQWWHGTKPWLRADVVLIQKRKTVEKVECFGDGGKEMRVRHI
jgi:hypothetical protein